MTRTPLNGITTSGIRPSRAARSTSAIWCTTLVRPGSRIGKQRRVGSCSASTAGPQKSRSVRVRSLARQSVSGRPSSSISQARSAPRSIAQAQAVVEAAGAAAVRGSSVRWRSSGRVRRLSLRGDGQPLPRAVGRGVVDDEDLSDLGDRPQPRDQSLQQVEPVVGDHHGSDARRSRVADRARSRGTPYGWQRSAHGVGAALLDEFVDRFTPGGEPLLVHGVGQLVGEQRRWGRRWGARPASVGHTPWRTAGAGVDRRVRISRPSRGRRTGWRRSPC